MRSEQRALQSRLDELRPVLAEADRIRRRLATIDALLVGGDRQSRSSGRSARRKRFSTEARALQALDMISERPEELRRKDIAEVLGVQIARAGKVVRWLLDAGLVEEHGGGRLVTTQAAERLRGEWVRSQAALGDACLPDEGAPE